MIIWVACERNSSCSFKPFFFYFSGVLSWSQGVQSFGYNPHVIFFCFFHLVFFRPHYYQNTQLVCATSTVFHQLCNFAAIAIERMTRD